MSPHNNYNEQDGYWRPKEKSAEDKRFMVHESNATQRRIAMKNTMGGLLKAMVGTFIKESGDIDKVLNKHRENFNDIVDIYSRYIIDIIDLYEWMGLPTSSLVLGPMQYAQDIKAFVILYKIHRLADIPMTKIIKDIFSNKEIVKK